MRAHAGVRPGARRSTGRTEQDLLWIRDDFLRNERRLDKVIVHGHTPAEEAYVAGVHRIGLDTGAYRHQRALTAHQAEGRDTASPIQVRPGE